MSINCFVRIRTAHQQDVADSSMSVTLVGFPKVAGKFPLAGLLENKKICPHILDKIHCSIIIVITTICMVPDLKVMLLIILTVCMVISMVMAFGQCCLRCYIKNRMNADYIYLFYFNVYHKM